MSSLLFIETRHKIFTSTSPLCNLKALCRQASTSAHRVTAAHPCTEETSIGSRGNNDALQRMPTLNLLRSYILGRVFASPWAIGPGLAVLKTIAHSNSRLLNPDSNPILTTLIKPTIYDQFCAGRDGREIEKCSTSTKELGINGIILAFAKEIELSDDRRWIEQQAADAEVLKEVTQWRDGMLTTLNMIGSGDLMAIKITGAGYHVMEKLLKREHLPQCFHDALNILCARAKAQGARILVDAEQQAVQGAIDDVAIGLMRKWNTDGKAVVYNTIQAYLKSSRTNLSHQLHLSQQEGWRLGVKLVRGAYIGSEERGLILDTKEDTDASYNGIVHDLLTGNLPGMKEGKYQQPSLLIAGHNSKSVEKASVLAATLARNGALKVKPEFAQLQGMADDVSCEIAQASQKASSLHEPFVPRVYKYLVWGSVQECMLYLVRRAIENRAAADRMKDGYVKFGRELRRRLAASLRFQS